MKRLLLIFSLLTATSCTQRPTIVVEDDTILISINTNMNLNSEINISEFADSVQYIALETKPECLIHGINQVLFTDDFIIVDDRRMATLFFFDPTGKFLHKINKLGKGPGEYIQISHTSLDPAKESIMIYDYLQSKIVWYALDGRLIGEIKNFSTGTPVISNILPLADGNYLCYSNFAREGESVDRDQTGLWLVDSDGKFIRNLFKYETAYPTYNTGSSCIENAPEGYITIRDGIFNNIYRYRNDSLFKYISYDIVNGKTAAEFAEIQEPIMPRPYTLCLTAQDKGNYIISSWADENSILFFTLFDKVANTIKVGSKINFKTSEVPGFLSNITDNNLTNVLLTTIDSQMLDQFLNDRFCTTETLAILQKMTQDVTEVDRENMNPILQLLHVK